MDIEAYISSGILEAYVLGTASAEEAAILQCVAKNNPRVQEALAEASRTLEAFADLHSLPAPDVKAAIWNQIGKESTTGEAPERKTIALPAASTPRVLGWKMLAAAASLLLVVSAGAYFGSREKARETNELLTKTKQQLAARDREMAVYKVREKMLTHAGMQAVMLEGVKGHEEEKAMVFWDKAEKKVYLDALNLPQAPAGQQYQLWAMVDGKPVSAGMYHPDLSQPVSTIEVAQAFAITLEKEGGVQSPTMENLMVMGAVKG